jgi:tRNA (guanine37-N1)-methyltransferase
MRFHIITIFPESFTSFLSTSMIGKAKEKWIFETHIYKLNDFSTKKTGEVDDKAFGMHGQVLSPEPLARAIKHVFEKVGHEIPVVYFTPRGEILKQETVENLSKNLLECILICGHYEGIDQRIVDIYVDYEISLGDFVLTGGELPAQIFIDSIVRLLPWVLGNPLSHEEESFSEKLGRQKEYPVYTRPADFRGQLVPEVLTSGNHAHIEKWKHHNLR